MTFEKEFPELRGFHGTKKQIQEKDDYYNLPRMPSTKFSELNARWMADTESQEYVNTYHIEKFCLSKKISSERIDSIKWLIKPLRKIVKERLGL